MSANNRRGMSVNRTVLIAVTRAVNLVHYRKAQEVTLTISGCRMGINIMRDGKSLLASTPDTHDSPPSKPLFSARVARNKRDDLIELVVSFVNRELNCKQRRINSVEIRLITRHADCRVVPVLFLDNKTRRSTMRREREHFPV